MIPQLQDASYEEGLSVLSLPSLSHWHFWGDLMMSYKILNGYFNSDFSNLYTFQLHLPGDTISNCSSIDQDYYADQTISSIE